MWHDRRCEIRLVRAAQFTEGCEGVAAKMEGWSRSQQCSAVYAMTGNCRPGWRCCTVQSHSHKVRRRRNRARVGFVRPSDTGELPRHQAWAGSCPRSPAAPFAFSVALRASLFQGLTGRLSPRWERWLWRRCWYLRASWVSGHIKTARGAGLHSPWGKQALRNGDPENVERRLRTL